MAKHKPKHRRLPKWVFPLSLEIEYRRILEEYNQELLKVVDEYIFLILSGTTGQSLIENLKLLDRKLNSIKKPAESEIFIIFGAVNKFNNAQFVKLLKAYYGFNVPISDVVLNDIKRLFIHHNVSLIKTLPVRLHSSIEQYVFSAKQRGLSVSTMTDEIQQIFNNSKFNAERIARDQIGKLNSQLTQLRQRNAGVRHYIWRGTLDERERATHKQLEGKVIEWDKPPSTTNHCHAGEEIMCRCWAEPIFEELL